MSTATKLVSSSADSFSGSLDADGFTTTISPFAEVSGAAPPKYDQTRSVASFDHRYELTPSLSNDLSLQVHATDMFNSASSPGIGVDNIGARGEADFSTASLLLTDTLPYAGLTALGLSVQATGVHSESDSSFVFGPDSGHLAGDASFHSLTITGALVGGKTLTFSGEAKPNKVLYSSPTGDVTITLDEQRLLLPPAAMGGVIGPTIFTDAIDIQLNGAKLFGNTISGHFDIGQSSASYPLIHPFA
jgi:hypothetical protein